MPSRQEIDQEIAALGSPFDIVRRKYAKQLQEHTGRNVFIYAMKPPHGAIWNDDVQGFMAAQHQLSGADLDLIIHSTGGSSEAAEQIVSYLRQKYDHIRVIVPLYAMSAATMIACAADEIVMGRQSALGPVDPQFLTPSGPMPAHAIVDEFERALDQIRNDPKTAAFWVPKLSVLQHGYFSVAKTVIERAESLCREWLNSYMKLAPEKATDIAQWLASKEHGSHGKPIAVADAEARGLKISRLEHDQVLQDMVLSVFHCTMLTLERTPCAKFVENHLGKGFFQMQLPGIPQIQAQPPTK